MPSPRSVVFVLFAVLSASIALEFSPENILIDKSRVLVAMVRPEMVISNASEPETLQKANASVATLLQRFLDRNVRLDLVVLPEIALGESSGALFFPAMSRWAVRLQSYLVFPYTEVTEQSNDLKYNAAAIFDRHGELVATYRKQRPTEKERSDGYMAGSNSTPVDTDFGRIVVLICHDIFFPDLWQAAHAAKADIVVWPSAFEGTGFLQAYSRLYSYYIIPAIPVPMAPKPFDFLGLTGLDSKNVNLIHSRTDLDLPNAVVWEIHINSRLICKANKQLEQLVYRLQKTHQQMTVFGAQEVYWEPCRLIQGVTRGRPAIRVDAVLRAAGLPARGMTDWLHTLQDYSSKDQDATVF